MILHTPFFFSGCNMLKIGDFVAGSREADERYSITNKNMTLAIVSYVYDCRLDDNDIEYVDIVVLKHKVPTYIGKTYKVISHFFDDINDSYKPTEYELTIQKLLLDYRCDVPNNNAYHRPVTDVIPSGKLCDIVYIANWDLMQKHKNNIYRIR